MGCSVLLSVPWNGSCHFVHPLLTGNPGEMDTVAEALTCESFSILKLCSFQTTSLRHQEQHLAGHAEQPCALQPSPSPLLLAKPAGSGRHLILHRSCDIHCPDVPLTRLKAHVTALIRAAPAYRPPPHPTCPPPEDSQDPRPPRPVETELCRTCTESGGSLKWPLRVFPPVA